MTLVSYKPITQKGIRYFSSAMQDFWHPPLDAPLHRAGGGRGFKFWTCVSRTGPRGSGLRIHHAWNGVTSGAWNGIAAGLGA